MGQIVGLKAKPKRCNLNKLSQLGTPAAGEYILVSYDNSMTANGQGNFDRYIMGDGRTAATALELKYLDDSTRPYIVEEVNKAVADIQPIEITGDVTNAPDEEDLTSENQGGTDVLKFKDKAYNSALYSGLGRVYLRKNIVTLEGTGKNVLTQAMVNTANTIYHIQYDYDLNGQTITMPAGCVLEFDGGSVKNGTISLNNCSIIAEGTIFGNDVTITGKCLQEASPDWFTGTDADKIEKAIAAFSCVKLSSRDYIITRTINVTKSFSLKGASIPDFFGDYSDARADMSASRLIASMNSGTMFLIRGTELTSPSAYGSFVVESVAFGLQAGISAGSVDGLTFTSYGGPSRPVVIRNCNFKSLGKAISFDTSAYNSSTVGTSCGTITIENNNIAFCNYGIYGAGRRSVGLCVIRQNNIEQNTQCGIYFNHEQSFGVVALSSLSIVDNQLEGQTEAVNILANGSFITISGNYFEKAGGQHIRVKQTSPAPLTICNNSFSNGALNIHCEGGILYARSNVRSTNYAMLHVYLYLKNVRIVENDIKIAECTGFILSARETATEKSFPIIARSNAALDAVRLGKFMKTIPVSSGLVQLPLSVTSYAAGTYTIAFLLNAPRTIDTEPYLVCLNTSTYETTLPVKSMAISDEMYVVQFCVTLTSTSNIRVYVRNQSATTLIYVSDVIVVNGIADCIVKTIYDTINVNQPSLTAEDKGANYFDTPLNEALFFNGSAWASAYGRIASQPRVVSDSSPSVINTALDTTYIINGTLGNVTINLPAVTDGKPHKIVINGKTDASPVFSYSSTDGKGIAYEYGYVLAASTLYEITCRFNGAKWIVSLLKLRTSIILPEGYTEVPYIEAQTGAYLDTGYVPNANSEFEIDFMPLSYRGAQDFAFGSRTPYVGLLLGSTTNKLYPIWGTSGTSNTYEVTQLMNVRWKMKLNSTKFIYNGTEETIVSQSLGTTTYRVYLFTINDNGNASGSYMKARVYGFKISESGVVLHNFIPCIDPNNVVGMYDTVGGQFYGSANAQPFTAGE